MTEQWPKKTDPYIPAPKHFWCQVCGVIGNCGIEPRFGYVVCEYCSRIPPIDIPPAPPNYPAS